MKAIYALFTGLGVIGILAFWLLIVLMFIGWVMNVFGLIGHLPLMDMETILRAVGIFVGPLGSVLGWFL